MRISFQQVLHGTQVVWVMIRIVAILKVPQERTVAWMRLHIEGPILLNRVLIEHGLSTLSVVHVLVTEQAFVLTFQSLSARRLIDFIKI